jgi:hypothetical protein
MAAEARARIAIENGCIGDHEIKQGPYCKPPPQLSCLLHRHNANILSTAVGVVPYLQNGKFVGRERTLQDLSSRLRIRENTQTRLALFGLGGVG